MNLFSKIASALTTPTKGLSPMSDTDTPTTNTVKSEIIKDKVSQLKKKKPTKKQQLANSKFLKEYSESDRVVLERVDFYTEKLIGLKESGRDSYITLLEKTAELTYIAIQSGNTLVEAKNELDSEQYDLLCKNYKVSKRTIDRSIELVGDKRVSELTLNELKSIKSISKKKLLVMKDLSDKDFESVVSGEDDSFKVLVEKNKKDKLKNIKSPYPNITDTQYKRYLSEPLEFSINELSVMKEKLKKSESTLRKVRKELRELKELSSKPTKSVNNTTKPTQNKKVS